MSLAAKLNTMDEVAARAALANCCAASAWVDNMIARRPFADDAAARDAAEAAWRPLGESDWLEAFAAHPVIGDLSSLRAKDAATKELAAVEQSAAAGAAETALRELADLNRDYRQRFGFIFIVCAAEKSAAEMRAILRDRIGNTRAEELQNAAAEQLKITRSRLERLACRPGDP